MTFAWPHLLWLLLVPAGLLGWDLTRRRRGEREDAHPKILRAEIGAGGLNLLGESRAPGSRRMRPWFLLGLAAAVVAVARPQWGRIEEPVFDQAREIMLAVDLSRSMLSPDVKPSRLERSKLLIQALLEKLQGERVGLIVFSGTAFLQSPLSADYEILREFLPALNPDFLPEGGTNYRALIDTALDAFGAGGAADRFMIILSDGEATDSEWRSRVDELKKKGIRVIGLGVGTIAGTMIPDGTGGFVKDDRGAVVLSKLESATLQELAESTGGVYRDASTWIDLAGLVNETVNAAKAGKFEDRATVRYVERFQWPLALAVWCFLLSFYYEFPVRPRTRDIALAAKAVANDRTKAAKSLVGLFLLGLTLTLLLPARLNATVSVAPPTEPTAAPAETNSPDATTKSATEPSMLGKVVSRLAAKDSLSAADLAEFARETLHWGRPLKDSGVPVPEGPVRDALGAVDQLQATAPQMADWADLRKQLEALLEKPEEKKQPQQKQQQQQEQNKKQDQKQSDSKPQDQSQPQQQPPQDQNQSRDEKQDRQQQDQQNQNSPSQDQPKPKSDESAFGDMKRQDQQPPKPQPGETQKVGGAEEQKAAKEPTDPALAIPIGKLEQLRQQDSPAELFQLMQPDRNDVTRKKPTKDW